MKTTLRYFSIVLLMITQISIVKAQTVLFYEDFEISPVTSLLNTWTSETQLLEGPSTCGSASRGTTVNFNSLNIDFQSSQNPSYFMAVNPQSPCGGFYVATVGSGTLDFSGMDSLVFHCRYFISNTLMWGPPTLQVNIKNGASNWVFWDIFTTIGNWDTVTVGIPSTQIGPTDTIYVVIGGGEGVGIDDISVSGFPITEVSEQSIVSKIKVCPNPVSDILIIDFGIITCNEIIVTDILGKIVFKEIGNFQKNYKTDISSLIKGIYFVEITDVNQKSTYYKILKN